jgi:hypothetical protein
LTWEETDRIYHAEPFRYVKRIIWAVFRHGDEYRGIAT